MSRNRSQKDGSSPTATTTERVVEHETDFVWDDLPEDAREKLISATADNITDTAPVEQMVQNHIKSDLSDEKFQEAVRESILRSAVMLSITVFGSLISLYGIWFGFLQGSLLLSSFAAFPLVIIAYKLWQWKEVRSDG